MSYEAEISLQQSDDKAYERWFQSTPDYWLWLTRRLTAGVKSSDGEDSATCSGTIQLEEDVHVKNQ